MHRIAYVHVCVALLFVVGCRSEGIVPGEPAAPLPDLASSIDLVAPADRVASSQIGDPCTVTMNEEGNMPRGSCAAGQICRRPEEGYPDGYCTQLCASDGACPASTHCTTVGPGYGACMKDCESDSDCRVGYWCYAGLDHCVSL